MLNTVFALTFVASGLNAREMWATLRAGKDKRDRIPWG